MNVFSPNDTSALLIFKKSILRIILNLVSAIKKVSWKNLSLLVLSSTWKSAITNLKVSRAEVSIFWTLTLVFWILSPSLAEDLSWFIGAGRSGGFFIGWLQIFGSRLLGLGFFGSWTLNLHLSRSVLGWAMISRAAGVRIPDHNTWL